MVRKKEEKKTEKEKVDERREEVLARGRKFKYPTMWTRHTIVISAIVVAVVALVVLVTGVWAGLYKAKRTDTILFNVANVVPLPVAYVDGESVLFSDYLMLYRSSIIPAEKQSGGQVSQANEEISNKYKRQALTEAEKYFYAMKLAEERGIEVSDEEVEEEFQRHLKIGGIERSEEGFEKIIADNFGLSRAGYERMLYLRLLREKVEMAIDETANETAAKVEAMLAENGGDYQKVAEALGGAVEFENTGGLVDGKNIDGGRATVAMSLEPGGQSGKFVSLNGDGYYFVELIEKTDAKANFQSLKVPFTEFERKFKEIQDGGKVEELIEVVGQE